MQRTGGLRHWWFRKTETPMTAAAATQTFHDQIIAILPKLRIQALALTRNRAAAEDLVQDSVCNALSAQQSFIPGTNFPAWMHRILRNRFISNLRKRRDTTDIDDVPSSVFASEAPHEDRLALKELAQAMTRLPSDQREALVMVVVHGMSYEALAESTGCAVGTAKSRVFRARRQLEAWLLGETKESAKAARGAAAMLARRLADTERVDHV
jgi:RNA polymerase sigma-70 factor (ECF subfamily)